MLRIGTKVQPSVEPSMRPYSKPSMPPPRSPAPRPSMGALLEGGTIGEDSQCRQEAERAEHDVDEEYRAPREPGDVRRDDEPGHDGPRQGGTRHDRPEHREHRWHLLAGKTGDHDAEALGNEQCTEPALDQPAGDQHGGVDGEAAAERGEGEACDADEEHPALSVAVTESTTDDEQDTEGERVARAQPLDQGLAAPDVAHDRRRRDVGDRRVHEVEDVGDDDDRQDGSQPPAQASRISECRRRVTLDQDLIRAGARDIQTDASLGNAHVLGCARHFPLLFFVRCSQYTGATVPLLGTPFALERRSR